MPEKLEIQITAAVSQALAGLQQTADAVAKLKATTIAANTETAASHNVLSTAVSNSILAFRTAPTAGAFMKDLGVIATGVATSIGTGLHGAVTTAGNSIRTHLVDGVKSAAGALNNLDSTIMNVGSNLLKSFGPLIGITAAAGIGIFLEQTLAKTIAWDDAVAVLSRDLGNNTVAASTWLARANFVGIQAGQLETAFTRLSVAITTHSADLKDMGIAVADSNGNLRSSTDILKDLTAWFQKYAGSQQALEQATRIFGRGNADMAVLMGLTTEQMKALDAEAQRLGLIIGTDQLNKWRAFDAEVKATGMVFSGLEMTIGHGLMPIFAILGSAISDFITAHLKDLIKWLAEAVAWVVGFISALTGQTFKFSEFTAAISQVSTQVAQLGTIQDLSGTSTRNATQAISDQIDALREANQVLQEQTDAKIAALNAEGAATAYDRQQTQSKQKMAADQKNVSKLRSDYDAALMLGDLSLAMSIYDQLTAAQQQMSNDQVAADDQVAAHERQGKISALQATQKQHNDETNDLINQLQKRQKANDAANAGFLAGAASTAADFGKTWDQAGKDFTDALNEASAKAGADMASNVKKFMSDIETMIEDPGNDPAKIAAQKAAWDRVGTTIGNALGAAMGKGFWTAFQNNIPVVGGAKVIFEQVIAGLGAAENQGQNPFVNSQGNFAIPSGIGPFGKGGHQAGGVVAGPFGAPRLVLAHGGERIVSNTDTPGMARAFGGPKGHGGPMTAIFNIYGATDTGEVARVVRKELTAIMGLA